jgi:hypothetical protein
MKKRLYCKGGCETPIIWREDASSAGYWIWDIEYKDGEVVGADEFSPDDFHAYQKPGGDGEPYYYCDDCGNDWKDAKDVLDAIQAGEIIVREEE